ncbi:amino acid adenylation domain-containing protein, partial [Actinomadura viridis]|uniref:amino acid adenylation domain-containing protein n=1 Tax=Actinomadura viridis TaxID=58110 RepID=UPI0036A3C346
YPVDRLAGMLTDADAVLVLGEEAVRDRLPEDVPACILDADRAAVDGCPDENPPQVAGPEELLYVYFTSGSTGRPKGVAVPHRVLLNVLGWHRPLYSEHPVALAYFPFTSDASFYEMATAWVAGGAVVLADEEDQVDPARLAALMDRHRVTKVIMPNVALDQLLEHAFQDPAEPGAPLPLASLREVVATGDRLKVGPAARAVFRRLEKVVLDNHYGPTEAHAVTAARLTGDPRAWPAVPSIGRPVAYARVHLLDEAMNPVPPGVPGELYAGGGGVARGYAGRPDLTAERFVPDPFSAEPGRRLYRTGDLARWRPDGTLEFLGRIDHQVKIRGYRIEPGEIETVLRAHPAVREAVAVPAETPGGGPSITAYVIPAGAPAGDAELRAHLRGRLPDYMIPSTFVTLSSFPLTVTGKVDRNRLPAPGSETGGFAAPRTREERAVAEVWADVLGRDRVGRTDDFFALGGHSLLATRVNARLRGAFGADLPLRALFENRTVADLARVLREAAPSAAVPLRAAPRGERLRLSFGQQRLWFLDQLMPGNLAYNMTGAYRFRGALDVATLERALDAVVARHEVLRTRYGVVDGEPYQVVEAAGGFVL